MLPGGDRSYAPMQGTEGANDDEVPQSVRSAQRRASIALAAAGVAFLAASAVAAAAFLQPRGPAAAQPAAGTRLFEGGVQPMPAFGLEDSKQSLGMMASAFGDMDLDDVMMPIRYHLLKPAVLRSNLGTASPAVRELPSGTRVFPLRHRMGWIQVVVAEHMQAPTAAEQQQRPAGLPGFGWLPLQQDGADLLQKDEAPKTSIPNRPVNMEDVNKRWAEVRAENAKLKDSLLSLQGSMRQQLTDRLKQAPVQRPAAVTAAMAPQAPASSAPPTAAPAAQPEGLSLHALSGAAQEVVDTQNLKQDAAELEKEVKELKPKQILHDLGGLFH